MNILNIFKKKSAPVTAENLSASTSSILGAFTSTIAQLKEVCNQARAQAEVKNQEINAAQIEMNALNSLAESNEKIISKFTELLK